jgi:hypothetical protein
MAKSRKVERWTSPHVHADHHRATAAAESIARAPNVQRVSHPLITLRHMRERVCDECGRVFRPSSRHFRCPACRAKDLCACGNEKQVKSATCASCRTDVGEANANWKGRCTRHKAGYVMVRAPDHPRASLRYVFEHILVAEELLGRYLVDGESVHHINGVRGDNRPENLELWTRPQPSGIRVSDAINWARQTYDRYVGAGTPPTVLTVSPEHPWRWRESNPFRWLRVRAGHSPEVVSERPKRLTVVDQPRALLTDFLCPARVTRVLHVSCGGSSRPPERSLRPRRLRRRTRRVSASCQRNTDLGLPTLADGWR